MDTADQTNETPISQRFRQIADKKMFSEVDGVTPKSLDVITCCTAVL
jgi:hypothetical protein